MKITELTDRSEITNRVAGGKVSIEILADCELETVSDADGIEIYNLLRDGELVGCIEDDGNGFEWYPGCDGNNSASLEDA